MKPVRIIVPFAPAGTTDIVARAVANDLSKAFGQSFSIENRAGAGGNLGSDAVAKAAIESGVATLPYPKHYPLKNVDDVFIG